MKPIAAALALLAIAVGALVVWRSTRGAVALKKPETLEAKLEILAQCGLTLAKPFRIEDLLASRDRIRYEKAGYDFVLVGLGMTEQKEPAKPLPQSLALRYRVHRRSWRLQKNRRANG